MIIENLTLAHFRHFSSLFTNLPAYKALYLRAYKALHLSRTLYKSALFMQNKPNFQKAQMNVNSLITMDYEKISDWTLGQNKPNSNPIKPNFQKAQMNVNSLITKDYRKKDDFIVRKNKPNSNPISVKPKMSANVFVTKDYENETALRPKKTNPNKANFRKAKMNLKSLAKKSGHTRLASVPKIVCKNTPFGYTHSDCRATAGFAQTRAIPVARKGCSDGGKRYRFAEN